MVLIIKDIALLLIHIYIKRSRIATCLFVYVFRKRSKESKGRRDRSLERLGRE